MVTVVNALNHFKWMAPSQKYNIELTKKEREVAKAMIASGEMKRAANQLHISPNTVIYHCTNIRRKVNEVKTMNAIYKAYRMGLIF